MGYVPAPAAVPPPPISQQCYTAGASYETTIVQHYTSSCMHLMDPPQPAKPVEVPVKKRGPASMNNMSFWR